MINDVAAENRPEIGVRWNLRKPRINRAPYPEVAAVDTRDLASDRIEINNIVVFADEEGWFFFAGKPVYLHKSVAVDLVFADTLRMTDQQVAITAAEEFCKLIIGQAGLYWNNSKFFSVEFLNAIRETDPAKIIFIKGNICQGALQQAFVYIIAEGIIPVDALGIRFRSGCQGKHAPI